jgi:hypothetical protein
LAGIPEARSTRRTAITKDFDRSVFNMVLLQVQWSLLGHKRGKTKPT